MGANDLKIIDAQTDKPETIQVVRPNGALLLADAQTSLAEAIAIVIDSDEMYEVAADDLKAVKAKLKELEEREKSLTSPLTAVITGIRDLFRAPKEKLAGAESAYKRAMLTYTEKKQAEAREAQRRADELARGQREEQQRAAAASEEAAQEAEQKGEFLEATSHRTMAEVHAMAAAVVSAPAVSIAAPKVSGVVVRKVWKSKLPETTEDKIKALTYIIANPQFLHLVDFSKSECDKLAKAMKDNMPVPGIGAVAESSLASGK